MRVISSAAQAALDSGAFAVRNGFFVEFPSGIAGFWDDVTDIAVSGVTYHGAPGGFTIGALPSMAGLGARSVDITMSGIDTTIASAILSEPYHQRPVTITRFVIAVDAPQVIHARAWFSGFIDTITWRERVDGTSDLIARCEDIGREITRKGARARADGDQRQIDSSDAFFSNVTQSITTRVNWGQAPPASPPQAQQQQKSFFQRIFG